MIRDGEVHSFKHTIPKSTERVTPEQPPQSFEEKLLPFAEPSPHV